MFFAALKEKMDETEANIKAQMNKVPHPTYSICYTSDIHECIVGKIVLKGEIRTHLAYIANIKKSCYMKQQSHSSESASKKMSIVTAK